MSDPQRLHDVLADDPLLMTPEEAARLLRVGRTTVYALMKAGDLQPVHIGRSCRLARAELERYVRRLQNPPQEAPAHHRRRGGPKTANQIGLFDPDPRDAA
jgi:excisionase family DNA binding protein